MESAQCFWKNDAIFQCKIDNFLQVEGICDKYSFPNLFWILSFSSWGYLWIVLKRIKSEFSVLANSSTYEFLLADYNVSVCPPTNFPSPRSLCHACFCALLLPHTLPRNLCMILYCVGEFFRATHTASYQYRSYLNEDENNEASPSTRGRRSRSRDDEMHSFLFDSSDDEDLSDDEGFEVWCFSSLLWADCFELCVNPPWRMKQSLCIFWVYVSAVRRPCTVSRWDQGVAVKPALLVWYQYKLKAAKSFVSWSNVPVRPHAVHTCGVISDLEATVSLFC